MVDSLPIVSTKPVNMVALVLRVSLSKCYFNA